MVDYLSPIMVRQLKASIKVPPPIRKTILLSCSPTERLAYNSLVAYIKANLFLTSLKGAEHGAVPMSRCSITRVRSARGD